MPEECKLSMGPLYTSGACMVEGKLENQSGSEHRKTTSSIPKFPSVPIAFLVPYLGKDVQDTVRFLNDL